MLTIDGRAGGGQLVRSAVSLAAISGTAFTIEDVRGTRPNPGLRPQHLAVLDLMADWCDAEVDGASLGATELSFRPSALRPRSRRVELSTAGSVALVCDVAIPLVPYLTEEVTLEVTGGTDVKWAPTVGYLRRVKLPLLDRFGYGGTLAVERTGFYPAGDGQVSLSLGPASPDPIVVTDRGDLERIEVVSVASSDLADADVAARQADRAAELLADHDPVRRCRVVETTSTGSSLLVVARFDATRVGFDELGERGKPAEVVAEDCVRAFRDWRAGPGAVDPYMADQLLVPLAILGGELHIPHVTDHVASNAELIRSFGYEITVDERADDDAVVRAPGIRS